MDAFLDDVYLSEDNCKKLCDKLTENGEKGDNPQRLIEYIDRAETKQKIYYLMV